MLDGGSGNPIVVDPHDGVIRDTIKGTGADGGSFDAGLGGDYLYVLQNTADIPVFGLTDRVYRGRRRVHDHARQGGLAKERRCTSASAGDGSFGYRIKARMDGYGVLSHALDNTYVWN